MTLNLSLPQDPFDIRPKITVVGVGGAGGNAVNNMIRSKLEGVDFLVANKGLDKHSAYQLTSIAGDVAITQLVDGTMGVHVKMPKGIFRK